ncbi:AraC family transcriptional regulator [Mesorhizobium sp. BAC0120]|uniref:AraC family transcriptional regulator n=1 Tax=Mesorhizobium sp. BAC0120 TaxID=3090670 RepID=UPI00298BE2D7|nr:AraC family transcriptional regulator [Mesorhizobium sp. BAC0120]MDW6023345.1 AraC family transcriptional regulator [Mesorhizobium sp. BAC0120]
MWRDLFARSIVKVDLEPSDDEPFRSESVVHVLPDLTIRSSSASAATVRRTRGLVADGDDNLVLTIMKKGRMTAQQRDREVNIADGGAYLWSNASTGYSRNSSMDLLTIAITRRSLEATVADIHRSLMRPIPALSEPLRLLISYVGILQSQPGRMPAALLASSSTHIHDLAALALGATRDASEAAGKGGLRAARLLAVKADVLAHLRRPELSAEAVAARHGISPRYVRELFSGEETTFGDFVREHRLRRAYHLLSSTVTLNRTIGEIAAECGFGDLSHFNHGFRRRFGVTPGGVRAGVAK